MIRLGVVPKHGLIELEDNVIFLSLPKYAFFRSGAVTGLWDFTPQASRSMSGTTRLPNFS